MPCASYSDPRLAAVYDPLNPSDDDILFYLDLAGETPKTVLDMGCGTGRLACELAARGHQVTGADPAAAMLDIARSRSGGEKVTWIETKAADLSVDTRFDLIIMTGHVFQVFLDDQDVRAALRTGDRHEDEHDQSVGRKDRHPPIAMIGEAHFLLGEELMMIQGVALIDGAHCLVLARPVHDVAMQGPFEDVAHKADGWDRQPFPPADVLDIGGIDIHGSEADGVNHCNMKPAIIPADDPRPILSAELPLPIRHRSKLTV